MKKYALYLAAIFASLPSLAQYSSSDVISQPSEANPVAASRSTDSFRLLEIQVQTLQRAVQETIPLLSEVTGETNAAANPTSTGEALAGVLGNILRGNTNQSAPNEPGKTNLWGNILRGVLGTNQMTSAQSNSTMNDLVALRVHLERLAPVLDRLAVSMLSTNSITEPLEDASTEPLMPTGRGKSDSP